MRNIKVMAGLFVAASLPVAADAIQLTDELTLGITPGVVSDYRSMGTSRSYGKPAVQLDVNLAHSSGAMVGVWGSSIDYNTKTRLEQGYYLGYFKQITENIDVLLTVGRYEYPESSFLNTNEFYGYVDFYGFRYGYLYDWGLKYSPNAAAHFIGYNLPLPNGFNLYAQYGYDDTNVDIMSANGSSRQAYRDWKLSLSRTFWNMDWTVSYVDNDISKGECNYLFGDNKFCKPTVTLGVKKTF
ncbi:TorF family putative porin [Pseudomonas monteilii]|uniref:TorF family putative porin n=1 Tax=Pseudomonas monteilii TaxID=76759 RepID=UPI003839DFF9